MAQPSKDPFQELLKDIFLRKDELENDLQNALALSVSKEELNKLNLTITKLERVLDELKHEISQRIKAIDTKKEAGAAKVTEALKTQLAPVVKRLPLLPTPVISTESTSALSGKASQVFQSNFQSFRKNRNIPDTWRIFLNHLSRSTTEESLFTFFSNYGNVLDIKVFSFPSGETHSGAVGFDRPEIVEKVLNTNLFIDGTAVVPHRYYTKEGQKQWRPIKNEKSEPNIPSTIWKKRFQVFCGGIPLRATEDDVMSAFSKFGKIREIRLSYIGDTWDHRGFAFIDFEEAHDAVNVIKVHHVEILGKQAEAKPNLKPEAVVMADDGYRTFSGSVRDLTEALPKAKPLTKVSQGNISVPRAGSEPLPGTTNHVQAAETCVICKAAPRNCRLLWCAHTETCMNCGTKLKNCPREGCEEPIVERQQLE